MRDWMRIVGEWISRAWNAVGDWWVAWRSAKIQTKARGIEIKESGEELPPPKEKLQSPPIQRPRTAKEITPPDGGKRKLVFVDDGVADRDGTLDDHDEVVSPPSVPLSIKKGIRVKETEGDEQIAEISEDEEIDYVPPSLDLLEHSSVSEQVDKAELEANAELLRAKLADFDVEIESVSVTPGPVVTLYELVPASGVKISRIESLEDDIALALKAKGIRIIAPIPGKGTVGVEIPNHNPALVRFRSVINTSKFRDSKAALPLALGKTISGEVYIDDLAKMPHLLIAGATGSGKSVGINTIMASLIYRLHPSDVKFVVIDPKKIELALFSKLKSHFLAVSPDIEEEIVTSPANAVAVLKSVELEMEKRYDRLAAAAVRNIGDYNERFKSGRLKDTETIKHRKLPYLIVFIDELADLMITAARDVEEPIARLAQLARAVGIHLVLATQRPSVDVITGVIKANFSARIAYQVASKTDSRTILDMNGAEQLLGSGDMLYLPPGSPKPIRIQNAFLSADEVERIVDHIASQQGYSQPAQLPSMFERKKGSGMAGGSTRDDLFEEAAKIIVRHQQGSVSLLQRRLKVGYSRAARLVDELEAAGIVGPFDGSKAREVLVETEVELEMILKEYR
ncbi:MAG: DNA translocase FtsK [Ignavibacteria bacterium]|nr:DNA translocase FtsK [Ignavibacteria bacterium]